MNFERTTPSVEATTHIIVDRFNDAFNRHDSNALASLLTDDTVFENTSPPPDGQRVEGNAAVVEFWRDWFARNPSARFEAEEIIVSGDRAVVRWVYHTRTATDGRGTCEEWTCSPCETGKWPREARVRERVTGIYPA